MTPTTSRIRTVADLRQALRHAEQCFALVAFGECPATYVEVSPRAITLALGLDEDQTRPPDELSVRATFHGDKLYIG